MTPPLPAEVQAYVDAIPPEHRALFDRVQGLVLEVRPDVEIVLAYAMPTYRLGRQRLHVATWKHGISLYGWHDDGSFAARHPGLLHGRGTIQLRPGDADDVTDDGLRAMARATLTPPDTT